MPCGEPPEFSLRPAASTSSGYGPVIVLAVLLSPTLALVTGGCSALSFPGRKEDTRAQRALARGDRALEAGHLNRARHAWLRVARLETALAASARQRLMDLLHREAARHWFHTRSEHFLLLALPDVLARKAAAAFLQRRETTYQKLVNRLGQRPDGPITIYVYGSSREAWNLLGRDISFADPMRREIHVRVDQEPGHEETHIIAWSWNHRGSGVPFLEEGLAVALSTHPGSPAASAAAILARGTLPDLADLVARFRDFRDGYVLAGSFISTLLEEDGIEAVRRLYTGPPSQFTHRLEQITGKPLAWLQATWETELAAQGTASREPIVKALALLRLDRLEEALSLLEQQHQMDPGNPALDFALAHALREKGDLETAGHVYRRMLKLRLPYHLAWMRQRAQQALAEMEAATTPAARPGTHR